MGIGKYLGLPSMIGISKKAVFSFNKDRVWKRINAWNSRNFSRACKEVMIKFVAKAIPSFFMSIFTLPKSLIDEIHKMLNSF